MPLPLGGLLGCLGYGTTRSFFLIEDVIPEFNLVEAAIVVLPNGNLGAANAQNPQYTCRRTELIDALLNVFRGGVLLGVSLYSTVADGKPHNFHFHKDISFLR
jgi:hypothetical protein